MSVAVDSPNGDHISILSSASSSSSTLTLSSSAPLEYYPHLDALPRSSIKSHYRPHSTIYNKPVVGLRSVPSKSRRRSLIRPISSMGFDFGRKNKEPIPLPSSNSTATLLKGRPSPGETRRITQLLKRRPSLSSAFTADSMPKDVSAPSPGPIDPTLASSSPTKEHKVIESSLVPSVKGKGRATDEDHYELPDKYVQRKSWIKRKSMIMHPYPGEAPYMQAYNPAFLENDKYTDILLRRLTKPGSPTFVDYSQQPPSTVLDLGCGKGHWVVYAASIWKDTEFTAFDLVDITMLEVKAAENISFVPGNFVKFGLPFADRSFDLVRMANLSLCIPGDKWAFVFNEVKRVLTVRGQLEVIDDQMFFPYAPSPTPISKRSSQDEIEEDEDLMEDKHDRGDESYLSDEDSSSSSSCEKFLPFSATTSKGPALKHSASLPSMSQSMVWERRASKSRDLELLFERMLDNSGFSIRSSDYILDALASVFGVGLAKTKSFHVKLAPFTDAAQMPLPRVGDEESVPADTPSTNSKVDISTPNSSDLNLAKISRTKRRWLSFSDKKEKNALLQKKSRKIEDNDLNTAETCDSPKENPPQIRHAEEPTPNNLQIPPQILQAEEPSASNLQLPPGLSAKAALRLGISYSTLAAAAAEIQRAQPCTPIIGHPQQSPGIIVWPDTFIPLSPLELEMHACKNLHVLLGCKYSIAEWIEKFVDEDGSRVVSDEEFYDAIWDYECFRRARFHWPTGLPEAFSLDDDETTKEQLMLPPPPIPSTPLTPETPLQDTLPVTPFTASSAFGLTELTHLRTINVYTVMKS